jgi:hypothetical protein
MMNEIGRSETSASRTASQSSSGRDLDPIDDLAHALDLGDDRPGDLLQMVGREEPDEAQHTTADVARDVLQRQVAAAPEAGFRPRGDCRPAGSV